MNRNTLLLIIDAQKDFCYPNGTLYVKGAEKDMVRLGKFISPDPALEKYLPKPTDFETEHNFYWRVQNDKTGNLSRLSRFF